jgi:hypothetical protein
MKLREIYNYEIFCNICVKDHTAHFTKILKFIALKTVFLIILIHTQYTV